MMVFISVMAALTAIVVLATKIVEFVAAWKKHQREAPVPAVKSEISTPSQTRRRRTIPWFSLFVFILAPGYLLFSMFAPLPAFTRQDVATLCLCAALFVIADRNLGHIDI